MASYTAGKNHVAPQTKWRHFLHQSRWERKQGRTCILSAFLHPGISRMKRSRDVYIFIIIHIHSLLYIHYKDVLLLNRMLSSWTWRCRQVRSAGCRPVGGTGGLAGGLPPGRPSRAPRQGRKFRGLPGSGTSL